MSAGVLRHLEGIEGDLDAILQSSADLGRSYSSLYSALKNGLPADQMRLADALSELEVAISDFISAMLEGEASDRRRALEELAGRGAR